MPSFATIWEYACGHTQELHHASRGEDDKVIKEILPVEAHCRMCIRRVVLSAVSSTVTCLPLSAIREVKSELQGMGPDETRRYVKALAQRVCRPSDVEGFQVAMRQLVACN
ncbi:hypothetical protein PG993_013628 [Apiospora rasikravindrae]|uniref:Saposin B-type domain-containing protein n=1 Tax=Apiospora rasikravindrae TaxID=990691 RepID=A0ABR1RR47_9PEZI